MSLLKDDPFPLDDQDHAQIAEAIKRQDRAAAQAWSDRSLNVRAILWATLATLYAVLVLAQVLLAETAAALLWSLLVLHMRILGLAILGAMAVRFPAWHRARTARDTRGASAAPPMGPPPRG